MRKRVNISLEIKTIEKLKELAQKDHKSVSQWITDKIWETVKAESASKDS